jgi:hypothetical protein
MEEKTFFNKGKVLVSNSRFIVEGQTYAMSNVTSVKSGVTKPSQSTTVVLGFVGLFCINAGNMGVLFGIGFILAAFYSWKGKKTIYTVILNTSAGENKALSSEDESYVNAIIMGLNEAIVSRG